MKMLKRVRNLAIVLCLLTVVGLFPGWFPEGDEDMIGFMWLVLSPITIIFLFSTNEEIKKWRRENYTEDIEPYITVESTDEVFCATYYDHHSYTGTGPDAAPVFIPVLCGPTRKCQLLAWMDAWGMAFSNNTELIWRHK